MNQKPNSSATNINAYIQAETALSITRQLMAAYPYADREEIAELVVIARKAVDETIVPELQKLVDAENKADVPGNDSNPQAS